jgi:hypothetical protein
MSAKYDTPSGAVEAALAVIEDRCPACLAAFLAGSVVRGEATATSDLDIMVVVPEGTPVYRESFRAFGWPIELFVHTPTAHRRFVEQEAARRRPSTSTMDCDGIVLRDVKGVASQLKKEACALLDQGPPPLTANELALARYQVSDLMDDLADARAGETFFIAAELAEASANLVLDCHQRWRGGGKWTMRMLRRLDPQLADRLAEATQEFCASGDSASLLAFAHDALALCGGRLWEGFRLSGDERT